MSTNNDYTLNWSDDSKGTLTLAEKTSDSTSTSLTLTGKGLAAYGEIQQENFLKLLEHFASGSEPVNPTIGQLWYDTSSKQLSLYKVKTDNTGNEWVPLYDVDNIGFKFYIQETDPSTEADFNFQGGNIWYHPSNEVAKIFVAIGWFALAHWKFGTVTPPSPEKGEVFYNTATNRMSAYMNNSWNDILTTNNAHYAQSSEPGGVYNGATWYNTAEGKLYIRVNNSWIRFQIGDEALFFSQPDEPASIDGGIWYDTNDNKIYIKVVGSWQPLAQWGAGGDWPISPQWGQVYLRSSDNTLHVYATNGWQKIWPFTEASTPYDGLPLANGAATPGSSGQWSRGDHVHPAQTVDVPTAYGGDPADSIKNDANPGSSGQWSRGDHNHNTPFMHQLRDTSISESGRTDGDMIRWGNNAWSAIDKSSLFSEIYNYVVSQLGDIGGSSNSPAYWSYRNATENGIDGSVVVYQTNTMEAEPRGITYSGGTITIQKSGLYCVSASVSAGHTTGNGNSILTFYKNGATTGISNVFIESNDTWERGTITISAHIQLTAGDNIKVVYNKIGSDFILGNYGTFSGFFLTDDISIVNTLVVNDYWMNAGRRMAYISGSTSIPDPITDYSPYIITGEANGGSGDSYGEYGRRGQYVTLIILPNGTWEVWYYLRAITFQGKDTYVPYGKFYEGVWGTDAGAPLSSITSQQLEVSSDGGNTWTSAANALILDTYLDTTNIVVAPGTAYTPSMVGWNISNTVFDVKFRKAGSTAILGGLYATITNETPKLIYQDMPPNDGDDSGGQ